MPTSAILPIVFLLPISIRCSDVPVKPIVGMHLTDTGLHRELSYSVQFSDILHGKDCEYILEQLLPAGVYISVDQLNDLKRLKKLNAMYPPFVDIELPTEKSKAFTILLKGIPQHLEVIKLPLHYRYHAPSKKSKYDGAIKCIYIGPFNSNNYYFSKLVPVEIPIPKLYIKCVAQEADSIEDLLETASKYKFCLNVRDINFVQQSNENDSSSTIKSTYSESFENCEWYLTDVHFQLKSDLRADIPIGYETSFPPVLYATIIISWVVSLYTVYRTNANPRRINYKLEEQRILQNKIK
ncbi:uncharacterized protein PIG-X isoform X1 [Eurosta solidaginis]|uniref:uncharacterized protein PIG-X isoform X1 n=1 Tax=Eurosta solidaginis TaxID=178769 RepID=UPI003530F485